MKICGVCSSQVGMHGFWNCLYAIITVAPAIKKKYLFFAHFNSSINKCFMKHKAHKATTPIELEPTQYTIKLSHRLKLTYIFDVILL